MERSKPPLLPVEERKARVERANEFIRVVASCGRKFFRHDEKVAHFFMDGRGRLWFRDDYSDKAIYVCCKHEWRGFSNGGTLRALTECLRDYIRIGKPIWVGYFEPLLNGECRWGYGSEAMSIVRVAAEKLNSEDEA